MSDRVAPCTIEYPHFLDHVTPAQPYPHTNTSLCVCVSLSGCLALSPSLPLCYPHSFDHVAPVQPNRVACVHAVYTPLPCIHTLYLHVISQNLSPLLQFTHLNALGGHAVHVCVCVRARARAYMYIYRERDRETERQGDRESTRVAISCRPSAFDCNQCDFLLETGAKGTARCATKGRTRGPACCKKAKS